MKLSKEQIKEIIPHRDPMLLVDTVEEMNAGGYTTLAAVLDGNARPLNEVEIGKKTAFIIKKKHKRIFSLMLFLF